MQKAVNLSESGVSVVSEQRTIQTREELDQQHRDILTGPKGLSTSLDSHHKDHRHKSQNWHKSRNNRLEQSITVSSTPYKNHYESRDMFGELPFLRNGL